MSDINSQAGLASHRPVIVLHPNISEDRAAEDRVRAFLTAQAEEDAVTGKPTTELQWAVSDDDGLVTLYTADLHRLLDALAAGRRGRA